MKELESLLPDRIVPRLEQHIPEILTGMQFLD